LQKEFEEMIKGLTKRAHKLLTVLAQDEGRRNLSSSLLPEHVLLALIKSGDGVGYEVLENQKVNILKLQLVLEQSLKPEKDSASFADLIPSRRLRTLLDSAAIESRTLRHEFVGTEHLVIAAAKEEKPKILILPEVSLRHERDKFLDDYTLDEVKEEIGCPVFISENGTCLLDTIEEIINGR
jgi:ATP-dependent Clp protease ATP-binding subunit ClpA